MAKRGLLLAAVATLTGTIIGAGFLGIPHVVAKSGFLIGIAHIVAIGLIIMLINLYLGEISLRTKGLHQLPGYARRYLGKFGSGMMFFSMIFGIYSALTAYLLGEGQSLSFVIFGTTTYALLLSIAFFALMAFLVYKGIEALKRGESIGLIAVLVIVALIAIFFIPKINLQNLTYMTDNPVMAFFPYSIVLFSFLAFSSLPELERELKGNERLMKKAILIGSLIPIVAYLLFTFVVVGFAGRATPEIATIVLGKLPSLLAIFTMFTAFFALSMAMRDMYMLDFRLKKIIAWLLACFVPLIIFLLVVKYNLTTFIKLLELSGSIAGGIAGIAIVLMAIRAKKLGNRKPEYSMPINWFIVALLIALFAFGMGYQFLF